jgi:DNA-binding IclR family transcriptional regulator
MDRANAVQKDHKSDTHDEREIIALLGLSLGHRHLELLMLLFTHPLLHLREIAALLEREMSSIERYLGILRGSGCIEPLETDIGQRWHLSERGLHLIAATHHINVQRIAIQQESDDGVQLVQQGVDVLVRHIEHTAGLRVFISSSE